jgi:YD repeat-containing protein
MLMRRRQGFVNRIRIFVFLLVSCVALSQFIPALVAAAHAQSVSYAYDADGRLSAVADGSNNVAGYQYDQLGNLLGISRNTGVGFDVVPFAGSVNTQVAIYGLGFSATLNQNTVKFNGTTATVLSATPATNPTKLLVDVPSGASTGPVSVTTPSGSSTGTASFKVN